MESGPSVFEQKLRLVIQIKFCSETRPEGVVMRRYGDRLDCWETLLTRMLQIRFSRLDEPTLSLIKGMMIPQIDETH